MMVISARQGHMHAHTQTRIQRHPHFAHMKSVNKMFNITWYCNIPPHICREKKQLHYIGAWLVYVCVYVRAYNLD